MQQICNECKWYRMPLCVFNPQTVDKDPDDTCSHWTPKKLNETSSGSGTYIAPTQKGSYFVNENY